MSCSRKDLHLSSEASSLLQIRWTLRTSNMILEPLICTLPLVVPSQVMDPDNANQTTDVISTQTNDAISTQTNDAISTQTNDAISTQTNDVANQGLEVNTQFPGKKQDIIQQPEALPNTVMQQDPDNADHTSDVISTQNNDAISTQTNDAISTQTNDVTNQGIEVNTQVPGTYRKGLGIQTQLTNVSNHGSLSAEVDRQNVLDAADALMLLHNSPQAWQETSSTPGVAFDAIDGLKLAQFSFVPERPVPLTMEHQYKADVDCGLSYSECNMGNETGAPLFAGPGLRGSAKHRGRGHRSATRIQTRPTEQKDKVGVVFWPPNLECNVGNKTGTPLVIGPGLRGPANHRGRGHRCAKRTQASGNGISYSGVFAFHPRIMESKTKVGVCFWPSNLECSLGDETGALLVIGPGLRGHASRRGRGANYGTRTQTRTMDQSNQLNVCYWPSNLECNMGNETGVPLGIEPGLRGPANHPGRGHGCASRTQDRDPIASDQTSVSATFECEEILEAALALMNLKISSWTWR
ncbi:hypothetical protein LEMLEM_LOCUS17932 [Lemmus lemmus]